MADRWAEGASAPCDFGRKASNGSIPYVVRARAPPLLQFGFVFRFEYLSREKAPRGT